MSIGPIQFVVIGFETTEKFRGEIVRKLDAIRASGAVRLIDALFVAKDSAGEIAVLESTWLTAEEEARFGALIGSLIGLGAGGVEGAAAGAAVGATEGALAVMGDVMGLTVDDVLAAIDATPLDSAAALLLLEHTWAAGFAEAVRDAGGALLSQGFLTREALFMVGAELDAVIEAEIAIAEAAEAVEMAGVIKADAAREAVQALVLAEIIKEEAAEEAAAALLAAELIEEAAAEEVVEVLIAAELIEEEVAEGAIKAIHVVKKDEFEALYVQTAKSIAFADGVLTLQDLAHNTLYFSDRPDRVVGHVTSEEFLAGWDKGDDSFAAVPPNATLSILSADDIVNVVVVLSNPVLQGDAMSYHVEILDGEMPATGGHSALFIDVVGRPLTPVSVAGVHRRGRRRGRRRGQRRGRRRK